VLHLKIDEYDAVRQKYGSAVARQLSDVAEPALNKVLREMDVLSWLDHGEFVVMLPGKTQGEALIVSKKMLSATSHCVLPLVDWQLDLRFSEGIAELKPQETAQEILARARHSAIPPSIVRRITPA
jgi:PleD family two-component response regulator